MGWESSAGSGWEVSTGTFTEWSQYGTPVQTWQTPSIPVSTWTTEVPVWTSTWSSPSPETTVIIETIPIPSPTTETIPVVVPTTETIPVVVPTTVVNTEVFVSTETLPPVVTVSTVTQPGTLSVVTDVVTSTVESVVSFGTTVTVPVVQTVIISLIPVSGSVITAVAPSYTITNVATPQGCPALPTQSYYDVQFYEYAPPSPGIPPLATHQPIVYPNGVTSTSIYCNTTVFEQYLRTQLFDCALGRGPYQTLDCDCNIIVGPLFTGSGPTPTGPGITVTQSGPSGIVLDLGTVISGTDIPISTPGGAVSCATATVTTLSAPLIYTGPVTFVSDFYQAVQVQKRAPVSPVSMGTQKVNLPSLAKSSSVSPFTNPMGVLQTPLNGIITKYPGGSTKVLPQSAAVSGPGTTTSGAQSKPSSKASTVVPPPASSSTTTSSTTSSVPPTSPSPSTSSTPSSVSSSPPPTTSASSPGYSNPTHTTEVCQFVTYTGLGGFIVPELSISPNNVTLTETLPFLPATGSASASSGSGSPTTTAVGYTSAASSSSSSSSSPPVATSGAGSRLGAMRGLAAVVGGVVGFVV